MKRMASGFRCVSPAITQHRVGPPYNFITGVNSILASHVRLVDWQDSRLASNEVKYASRDSLPRIFMVHDQSLNLVGKDRFSQVSKPRKKIRIEFDLSVSVRG